MPPGHSSGFAAFGLQFFVCGAGGGGGGGGVGGLGLGPGLLGHRHAALPHWGHLMPPGHSCGLAAFGLHMIGPPPPCSSDAARARRPCSTSRASSSAGVRVIWHSTLVTLPFVPHGGTVVTLIPVMTMLCHFFAFARSALLKLPSSDHSVPFDFTMEVPRAQVVVVGRPGSGPTGTAGGGPGAAAKLTTLHFHLNGYPGGTMAISPRPSKRARVLPAWLSVCPSGREDETAAPSSNTAAVTRCSILIFRLCLGEKAIGALCRTTL